MKHGRSVGLPLTRSTIHLETNVTVPVPDAEHPLVTPCVGREALFFGPVDQDELKSEPGRAKREAECLALCQQCTVQMECLFEAMIGNDQYGFWGGMNATQRRLFRRHMRREGYVDEIPEGDEFIASYNAFHRAREGGEP